MNTSSIQTVTLSQEHLNNMGAARQVAGHLDQLAESAADSQLNIDLKEVERITSAGLNELIGINSQARSCGVRLVLLDVQEAVRDVFALTRLERMFEFDSTALPVGP